MTTSPLLLRAFSLPHGGESQTEKAMHTNPLLSFEANVGSWSTDNCNTDCSTGTMLDLTDWPDCCAQNGLGHTC